jgi:tetratricopeptide (TPR) repeat protein
MAIFDKTGQSETITAGWRSLELFIDRYQAIRLFLAYLHDNPPHEQILFFYGDGGNGKSLLLHFLRVHCCKRLRPEEWEYVRTVPQAQLEGFLQNTEGIEALPSAFLDFGMQPREVERPQDPFAALLMLRRQLTRHRARFPLYDFACVWYLRETGQLTQLDSLFPAEEMGFITELVNLLGSIPYVSLANAVLNMMSKRLGNWFTFYRHRRKLDESQVATILKMEVHTELLEALPRLFAHDLNTTMAFPNAPHRLVLFFDTHESFWGMRERESARDRFFQRDEWLRQLLGHIDLVQGIVVVVAGRDKPRWAQASRAKISDSFVDVQLIGHLSTTDAMTYLERAGITNAAMRECLVRYVQFKPDDIHPFYLGLCADAILASEARGVPLTPEDFHTTPQLEARAAELLDRLLRYVDVHMEYAVRALSACRAFNRNIYFVLGAALNFQATASEFQVLCAFSFVWRAEVQGEGWYRIHDLVRRLMHEHLDEYTRQAHEVLEHYYRECAASGDTTGSAEAIYHANCLDWERGVQEWVDVFEEALWQHDYVHCRALLTVRNELMINTDFMLGRVSQCEGEYFFSLARYDEAQQEFMETLTAYDTALTLAPDDVWTHTNKGTALASLGDIQAALAQHTAALGSYEAALATYDTALTLAPDDVSILNNKGTVLASMGDVQVTLARYTDALGSYEAALATYEAALTLAPDDVSILINKGNALARSGGMQATLARYMDALSRYEAAIATYDTALTLAPDDVSTHTNKANALGKMGYVYAILTWDTMALSKYEAALATYEAALTLTPDNVKLHTNKSNVLASMGDVEASLAQHTDALRRYEAAIATCATALALAPNNIGALINKGRGLARLGNVQATLARYTDALGSYEAAIATCATALALAPNNIGALINKGTVLASMGDVQVTLARYTDALGSYEAAIATYEAALTLAPDEITTHINKAHALASMGDVQVTLARYTDALGSYEAAIATYEAALILTPYQVTLYNNMGNVFARLGGMQAALAQHTAALRNYEVALATYEAALTLAPDDVSILINKGSALVRLGGLQLTLAQHTNALDSLEEALTIYSRSLDIAPNNTQICEVRDQLRKYLYAIRDKLF